MPNDFFPPPPVPTERPLAPFAEVLAIVLPLAVVFAVAYRAARRLFR